MSATKGLEIYLNDHLAGATAGTEMASKISAEHGSTPLGQSLGEIAREIQQDKVTLEELMGRLQIEHDPIKQAAGWIGERLSRLKLSESMTGGPELKQLLEFETLSLGVEGKLSMWRTLLEVSSAHAALAETDLDTLIKRAENQRSKLEDHRLQVASQALSG
ncbi:MAG: hypothetical protein M3Z25_02865 [Actinomycetota bacterium]|nr:hypothetical protein [Actinomycetota bacterium]